MRIPSFVSRHKIATAIGGSILALFVIGIYLLVRPKGPEYVTEKAQRGDVLQVVEAVGTVTSERDLELKFSLQGIVASVAVKEGDRVRAGQVLAQLRSGGLGAAIASQAASLQASLAELRALEEGTRLEDIAISEAEVQSRRAALEVARSTLDTAKRNVEQAEAQLQSLQREADANLAGQITTTRSTLSTQLVAAENAIAGMDGVFQTTIVSDAISKSGTISYQDIDAQRRNAVTGLSEAKNASAASFDHESVQAALRQVQGAITLVTNVLDRSFSFLDSLPETAYFSRATKETNKTALATHRTNAQAALSAITTATANYQNAAAGYDTKISSTKASLVSNQGTRDKAQADILTYEASLRVQEANLALKKAGARKTDIDAAWARVRQAQAGLQRAQADYAETLVRAPVAGAISKVNVKPGEAVPVTGPAITLLGDAPFRVEMFVSEVDVPGLATTQTGAIQLDAFPNVDYKIRVSEVDPVPTDVQGVSKYRVKLDFLYPHQEFKIGMTGDVTVVTGERKDVIKVPLRSVITNADGTSVVRVIAKDGALVERPVALGMEGQSGDVEVLTGVGSGETIVVLKK